MPKIVLRSHVNSLNLSDNYAINDTISEENNSEKGQRKTNVSKAYENELCDSKGKSNYANNTQKTHLSPISIVCSLPLYKISGILEKINRSDSNFFNTGTNYKYTNKLSKHNEKIIRPCMKILCLYCDKIFSSQSIQKNHVEKMHTLSKTRRFSSRHSTNSYLSDSKHQLIQSSSILRYYSGCRYCQNTKGHFANAKDFMELFFHMVDCHSEKYFGCKLCILRFQNRGKLTKHMNSVHKNTSFVIEKNWKPKNEGHSDRYKLSQNQHCSSQSDFSQCKIDCVNVMKNSMFSGDEPILSRLGVAQNRLPSNRKSIRNCRDGVSDMLLKSDNYPPSSKIRNKIGKILSTADTSDVVFRVPTRNDMSCLFEDDFYVNIISNVRDNILYYLDGKIMGYTPEPHSFNTGNQYFHYNHTQIHKATQISTSTPFPTLLTSDQYGVDISSTKLKRSITKHSWKWKWDSFKKFKFVNEGGKIIKKIKQPILNSRDLSKLDMWTQLTMRQKNRLYNSIMSSFSGNSNILSTEQRFNNQLNNILDARILPEIILEQNDQTVIKLECSNHISATEDEFKSSIEVSNSIELQTFFSILDLLPAKKNTSNKQQIILSGEWARPRCYLCIGCGTKFEKLKSLEEHKMFRHSHVYSTHYEIVGRELMACNLLKHFFIPKRAFNRYESVMGHSRKQMRNKNSSYQLHVPPEDESFDSMQSILNSCTTTNCGKSSTDTYDTDFKLTMHLTAISPTPSTQSASASDSMNSLQIKLNKDIDTSISCTKCRRKCSGVYDLYRHMLDCSGDYIWNMAKKRRYRYYCGSKKRRQCNKTYNKVIKKNQQKSLIDRSVCTEENPTLLKPKTSPRQRPSDAESIKKMLENLPPKRICKKILPTLSKTRKSKLLVKRKIFNSQGLKHKLSKRIRHTSNLMYKIKCKISANNSNVQFKSGEEADQTEDLTFRNKNHEDPRFSEQKIDCMEAQIYKCKESSRKLCPSNIISASEKNIILSTCVLSSKFNCVGKESRQISQTDYNGTLKSSVNECTNQEMFRKGNFPAAEVLSSNLKHSNYKKKRSKKINDCIAMLTGKLKEKLKTENICEYKGNDLNNLNCKENLISINKTAKRKTRSRKIVKLIADNSIEKISENYTSVDNHIFHNTNLQKTSTNKKIPVQIYNVSTSYKEKRKGMQFKNNLDLANELPLAEQEIMTNRSVVVPDIPSIYSLNPVELPRQLYIPSLNSLHSHNTQILPTSIREQIATRASYINHSMPTRRQTTCYDEGINALSKCYDDIRPLDLSTKTKELSKSNLSEVASLSNFICQTSNSDPLSISSKLHNKQFYSNLELLKIPQIKNSCCFNTKIENCPKDRINLKIKENNNDISDYLNNCIVPKPSLHELSLNIRNSYLIKKENYIKTKNCTKMNEVIISHINDAINSVISAENEKNKLEINQSNIEEKMLNELLQKPEIKDSPVNKLTTLKRCIRSKTVDNTSSDNKDNIFLCIDVEEFTVSNEIKSTNMNMNYDINDKISTTTSSNPVIYTELLDLNVAINNSPDNTNIKSNKLEPVQKQKRKRKNELAAIVADQLLESFKIDKFQRDNLKKLENLANEKSENLLTEALLMSTTKRNTSSTLTRGPRLNANIGNQIENSVKVRKQDQWSKSTNSKPLVTNTDIKHVFSNDSEKDVLSEKEHSLIKLRKKLVRNHVKLNENINKLKTSIESFTHNSNNNSSSDSKIVHMSKETSDDNLSVSLSQRNSILRPSILSKTLEPSNVLKDSKALIYSRDPRLNKNIHKEGNPSDFPSYFPRNRLRSSNNVKSGNKTEDIFDKEEDNYLHEIAKNVNEKILSSENGDFKFVHDEFEVESTCPEDSISKYCRSSTSMSVCSAPNLTDHYKFGSIDENTNTELIDMDIDIDNISVYTSFSQDVNRGNRKKKRRRSKLLSRKQKKKIIRETEEKFECFLCKKTFYASSSLTKHQTTLAHVSKVSEQEYLFSKTKRDTEQSKTFSYPEKNFNEAVTVKEYTCINSVEDADYVNEYSKGKSDYYLLPRITLNPDEKLFFECCNILKGSRTGKTEHYQDLSTKYPSDPYNQNATENSKYMPQNNQRRIFQDTFISNFQKIEDIHTGTYQNMSRFKTKAAMKGYENISCLNMDHNTGGKNKSVCKLTALAEIALGNEDSHDLILEDDGGSIYNNISERFGKDTNEIIKAANLDYSKEYKKNSTYSTTSSKTIMHCPVLKTYINQQGIKCQSDKIIIPERPFKNIGLDEKEGIQFQRPRTNSSFIDTDSNSVSIASYSDRDDFDFGSLSCDDDASTKICNEKTDKDSCISNTSSRIGPRSFENKSLIMDRIFKNANGKGKRETTLKRETTKSDINRIFDELRGNPIKNIKKTEYCENKILDNETFLEDECKDSVDHLRVLSNEQAIKKTKRCKQSSNEKQSTKTEFSKLQSELGMSTEEIAQLINEGQRKSKRRCATNRSKKLVEMWSSDEYEEFLSTKDIFALIEEKEKEEKKRVRKGNMKSLNTIKAKVDITIDNTKKSILKNCKARSNIDSLKIKPSKKVKIEFNNSIKFHKKESTNLGSVSKKLREAESFPFTKGRKNRPKQTDNIGILKRPNLIYGELSRKNQSTKNSRNRRSQTIVSNSREKRLASEKLYYWSSSSDEDFGRIKPANVKHFKSGEQYQKHGWIVGDSHKKLVTLLAIAKGNKKVEDRSVKKVTSKKKC